MVLAAAGMGAMVLDTILMALYGRPDKASLDALPG
jgi:hypothetical protein